MKNGKITKEQAHIYGAVKIHGVELTPEEIEDALENSPEIDWNILIFGIVLLFGIAFIIGYLAWFLFFHIKLL